MGICVAHKGDFYDTDVLVAADDWGGGDVEMAQSDLSPTFARLVLLRVGESGSVHRTDRRIPARGSCKF